MLSTDGSCPQTGGMTLIINDDNFYDKYHEPDLRLQKALDVHTRIDRSSRMIVAFPERKH